MRFSPRVAQLSRVAESSTNVDFEQFAERFHLYIYILLGIIIFQKFFFNFSAASLRRPKKRLLGLRSHIHLTLGLYNFSSSEDIDLPSFVGEESAPGISVKVALFIIGIYTCAMVVYTIYIYRAFALCNLKFKARQVIFVWRQDLVMNVSLGWGMGETLREGEQMNIES